MEEKNVKIDAQWEQKVIEQLAEESTTGDLLDLTQDAATHLAAKLSEVRHTMEDGDPDVSGLIRKIARVAVLLDAMQLRFGDAVEEEIEFLRQIEEALQ